MKNILLDFFNWVMGNGPRPENEVIPPEPPPALPFTQKPDDKYSRFHEATLKERYNQWLELHGLHLFRILYAALSVLTCIVIAALLLFTVSELPPFGHERNPANNEVVRRYVQHGSYETGSQNLVAGIIMDYRAFDTLAACTVLFAASMCVMMLMRESRRNIHAPPAQHDPILSGTVSLSVPAMGVMGCAIVINGHISHGGGLSGGAIFSIALILCGFDRVHSFFTERTFTITTSAALMLYILCAGYSFFTGANQLNSYISRGTIGNILSGGLILPINICAAVITAGIFYGLYALFIEGEI